MNSKNKHTIIVIILVFINILIKGLFLSSNSLAGDEPFSVYFAQMDIGSIIKLLSEGNNPPLYEIILHFWINIFGISEFSVRFPSLIFSCITVLFIYKLAIKHLNKRVALYSSIIFIFSNYHILFAHEARTYSLLGMLSIISMFYFLEVLITLRKESNQHVNVSVKSKLLLVIDILIIYTHYFGFFILITQFLFLLFNRNLFFKYWRQSLMCIGVIILFYTPNIIVFINRFLDSSTNGTWVKPPNGIDHIYNILRQLSNAPVVTALVILIFAGASIKYVIQKKTKQNNQGSIFCVFWFVFIFFFMFGISYIVPMFMDRYLMPAAIAFSFVVAISADYIIKKTYFNYFIPSLICILFISTVKPNITNKRNNKETVLKIKEIKSANTIVYLCPSRHTLNFIYYFDIDSFKNYNTAYINKNILEFLNKSNIYPIDNYNQMDISLLKTFDKVIFLDAAADFSFPENGILEQLKITYTLNAQYHYDEIFNIYEFKMKNLQPNRQDPS